MAEVMVLTKSGHKFALVDYDDAEEFTKFDVRDLPRWSKTTDGGYVLSAEVFSVWDERGDF